MSDVGVDAAAHSALPGKEGPSEDSSAKEASDADSYLRRFAEDQDAGPAVAEDEDDLKTIKAKTMFRMVDSVPSRRVERSRTKSMSSTSQDHHFLDN